MNVTFHTLTALATAAVLSSKHIKSASEKVFAFSDKSVLVVGFAVGVVSHGLLDYVPHTYPIRSTVDVALSLVLFAVAIFLAKPHHRLLLAVCFLGSIFPDLIDLAPAILNHHLGWSLPVVGVFPWHWRQYSGSIYDGNRKVESLLAHVLVVSVSLGLIYFYRASLFSRKTKAIAT